MIVTYIVVDDPHNNIFPRECQSVRARSVSPISHISFLQDHDL